MPVDFLRDPIWQFVGVVVAVLALAISLWSYFLVQRDRKALSYDSFALSLLSVDKEIQRDLTIVYKGNLVDSLHLVLLRVVNTGNQPIGTADYEQAIRFSSPYDTRILSAEVTEADPDSLRNALRDGGIEVLSEKEVVLRPVLLNPGDSVTIRVLACQFSQVIDVSGRIAGVKEIRQRIEPDDQRWFPRDFFPLLLGLFGPTMLMLLGVAALQAQATVASIFLIGIGLVLLAAWLVYMRKHERDFPERRYSQDGYKYYKPVMDSVTFLRWIGRPRSNSR